MARATRLIARLMITLSGGVLVGAFLVVDAPWVERHVLPSYCATNAAEWIFAQAARWIAAALGLLIVWKLAPALSSWVARFSIREQARTIVWIGIAVVAALGVGELGARVLHDRLMMGGEGRPRGSGAQMTRFDARLGWSYLPGRTTWTRMGDRLIAYSIDADGDRAASSDDRPDSSRPTILFAGESIAFGYGLPYDETYPYLVGRDLGVQAVNLAVVGYGNDQAHLRVVEMLPRFERPIAVVTLFAPSQIRRNVERWRPRLGLGPGGTLFLVPPSTGPKFVRLLQELPYHDDEALRVTAAILRATAEAARARGAFPLFVVTNYGSPCLHRDGEEAWIVEDLFVRQSLPFVRVDLEREDLLPVRFERHPSVRGTRKIAAAVMRALRDALGVPAASPRQRARDSSG